MDEAFYSQWTWHAGINFSKQLALGDVIADSPWQADLSAGLIYFGDVYAFPIQVIGTESEYSGTWLWAWANPDLDAQLREMGRLDLLTCANKLRARGGSESIGLLATPEFLLDNVDGHMLAMVASGMCNADAYYRGAYEGGVAYFLLSDVGIAGQRDDLPRIASVISQVISLYPVQHGVMIAAYLEHQGFIIQQLDAKWVATRDEDDAIMTVFFDEQGRLANLKFAG